MCFDRWSVVSRKNKDFKILAIQQGRLSRHGVTGCPNLKHFKKVFNHKNKASNLPTLLLYCFYFEIFIRAKTFAPS
jgi:hypothetical protein